MFSVASLFAKYSFHYLSILRDINVNPHETRKKKNHKNSIRNQKNLTIGPIRI